MTAAKVVVLGSANLDVIASLPAIPAPGETVLATDRQEQAGGKGLNQAVAVARADARTQLLAAVGDDETGRTLLEVAAEAGIDVSRVRRVTGPSGTAWIMVRPDGENAIVVDGAANTTITALSEEERATITDADLLVLQLETPLTAVAQAARTAHDAGVRVVLNAAPARPLPDYLLDMIDVLVVNEHEARQLAADDDPEAAAAALLRHTSSVVVTLGADGVLLADSSGPRRLPGRPATVVDTTGAGDTFTGVLAASLARGDDLDAAATRAVVAGALAVETAGAVPSIPTAEQIDRRQHETQTEVTR